MSCDFFFKIKSSSAKAEISDSKVEAGKLLEEQKTRGEADKRRSLLLQDSSLHFCFGAHENRR
uniref:Uncharacterized protein MANES_12G142800 n=1 Tax=Rhizophora mucronata TaxID=61149 RepID=A0A2P2LY59_RHIMU